MKNKSLLTAFTLAETLLTLVIVGVVAAMTIPTLKQHADEQKHVTSLQKAYSEVVAAVSAVEITYGDASTWDFSTQTSIDNLANAFIKTLNIAQKGQDIERWYFYQLNGEKSGGTFPPQFITADGMAWWINQGNYGCGGGAISIDTNGPKPPNTVGIDMHMFRLGHACVKAQDTDKSATAKKGDFGVAPAGDGVIDITNKSWACTAYAIKHKEMPWLYEAVDKCDDYYGK